MLKRQGDSEEQRFYDELPESKNMNILFLLSFPLLFYDRWRSIELWKGFYLWNEFTSFRKYIGDWFGVSRIGLWWLCKKSDVLGHYDTSAHQHLIFYEGILLWYWYGPGCWWWIERAASVTSISFLCSILMEMIGSQMQCLEEERYLKKDSNIRREISATLLSSSVPLKDFIIDKNTPNGSRLQSLE